MSRYDKLAVGFLFALSVIPHVFSVKCFDCKSSTDPKCADPFDNSTIPITDCNRKNGLLDDRPTMCRKIRQKVNGEWNYIRDCAYVEEGVIQGDERFCFTKTETNNILIQHCTCNSKDGCNSSYLFSPKPALLVSLLMVPCFFLKLVI